LRVALSDRFPLILFHSIGGAGAGAAGAGGMNMMGVGAGAGAGAGGYYPQNRHYVKKN
jgi:hypothetical protein